MKIKILLIILFSFLKKNKSKNINKYYRNYKMSGNQQILNAGYNNMYNEIFCNIFPLNNGFNTCSNCNYGNNMTVLNKSTETSEQTCLNKCKNNKSCTSYSYNVLDGQNNCIQYNNFPSNIQQNVSNINSGYDLSKFTYNYNNLSSGQQNNIKYKCANQYINNLYSTKNTDINLGSCLTINNNNGNTKLNYNPECVFNIYKQNNLLSLNSVIDKTIYNNNNLMEQAKTNVLIQNREKNYNKYNLAKINNHLINKELRNTDLEEEYSEYDKELERQNMNLYNLYPNTLNLNNGIFKGVVDNTKMLIGKNIKEGFDNENYTKQNYWYISIIIILIFLIILIILKSLKEK